MKTDWKTQASEYEELDVLLPKAVQEGDLDGRKVVFPNWIHFGGGNLYRGMHAEIAQDLLDEQELQEGVVVIETFDEEAIEKAYREYNNYILQVVMSEDGTLHKRLLDSTLGAIFASADNKKDWELLQHYFESPILKFVTFTITEKGYNLTTTEGEMLPIIVEDIQNGPEKSAHTMSIVTSLLYTRFKAKELPIAMVTTDNFSRNGEKFQDSILTIAREWEKNDHVPKEFIDYLTDTSKVTFPWSMVDRITPNPSKKVLDRLRVEGFEDLKMIQTSKGTNIAPFVNTEEVHYLVIEDSFPNGRPDLTKGGIILTDRETVDKIDAMKVTTCLNPLHTALAIFGSILGYDSIFQEMQDPDLKKLVEKIGYAEGLPVVEDPEIINPKEFIDEVINKRFLNPAIPDTPQRIAADTSQKLSIRFGETIKKYADDDNRSIDSLVFIPLVLAGWLRYLLAVDDKGEAFVPSPDPLLEKLQVKLAEFKLGVLPNHLKVILKPILSNEKIFGVNLYEVGLAEKVILYFKELTAGKGAVRSTLRKYLG